ncbi:hypothetical protein V8E36_000559, partial [Tilletia maclaganii]
YPHADGMAVREAARPFGNAPPGAVRFHLPPGFKGQNDEHRAWLEDSLDEFLPALLLKIYIAATTW